MNEVISAPPSRQEALSRFVLHALLWGVVLYCRFFIAVFLAIPKIISSVLHNAAPSLTDIITAVALLVVYNSYPIIYIICLLYGMYCFYQAHYVRAIKTMQIPGWFFLMTIILYLFTWFF